MLCRIKDKELPERVEDTPSRAWGLRQESLGEMTSREKTEFRPGHAREENVPGRGKVNAKSATSRSLDFSVNSGEQGH